MATLDSKTSGKGRRSSRQSSADGTASFLEQTLWKALTGSGNRDERIDAWLSLLALAIDNVEAGVVVLRQETEAGFVPVAVWPSETKPPQDLAQAAEKALEKGRAVMLPRSRPGEDLADLAVPIEVEQGIRGVVALTVGTADVDATNRSYRQMQWGAAWLREFLLLGDLRDAQEIRDRAMIALELFAVVLEENSAGMACRALVTELARRFDCDRVSIGFEKRGRIDVSVISHTAQFSEQMNLVRMLGEAMDEAVDQRAYIKYPADDDEVLAVRAHEELARKHRASTILTIPLFVKDRFIGALTLERVGNVKEFSQREIGMLDYVAACLSPILGDKRSIDRPLIVKAWNSLEDQLKPIVGPRHVGRKLLVMAVVAVLGFAYFAKTEYRIATNARIEGSIQRSITAPFDGFIREVPARPGDVVEEGARLVSLDDRDLVLERLKWVTEREKQQREYDRALGERNRSEVRIITTRIEQADAQIGLISEKLERANLFAPFSGIVIAGDLSQRIGDAVRKGETLMEVAPLTSYRVILNVDETQIEDVAVGQAGELVVAPLPDTQFPIRVTKIIPKSVVADGRSVFAVEATLTEKPERLRPGMNGVAKLSVDERRTLWVWTRPFLHWLRLFVWRWVP